GCDAVFGPLFCERSLPDGAPESLDDLTGDLLRCLALREFDAGNAPIEMCMSGLLLDDAVEDLRQYRMPGKLLHLTICLAGRHLVDRSKRHMGSSEAAAKQVRDRGKQIRVRMIGLW